jgi:HD-like signal output (HDOD) protein
MPTVRDSQQPGAPSGVEDRRPSTIGQALVVDKPRFAQLISRMMQGHFEVTCADGCSSGLKSVQELQPDMVLVALGAGEGLRMAELMGMSVRGRHTPCVLTCIKPQADLVDRALTAGVDMVLAKPFAPSVLIERAGGVLKTSGRPCSGPDEYRTYVDFLRDNPRPIEGLPAIEDIHVRVRQMSGSESTVNSEVGDQVGMGPVMQDAVLGLVGAYKAVFSRRVATLRGAITLGGFCEVANLALTVQAYQAMAGYHTESRFDRVGFWKHAVGTAMVARTVAKRVKEGPDTAFMAGFLHDVGKLVLDRFYPSFYGPVVEVAHRQRAHTIQVELPWLGTTHAHVGAYLSVRWNLEECLTETILAHHAPTTAKKHTRLASVVHVADAICRYLEFGDSGEVVRQETDDPALYKSLLKLGVGPQVLERLIEAAEEELKSADAFLDVLLSVGPAEV